MKFDFNEKEIELIDDNNFTPFSADNSIKYNHQFISDEVKDGVTLIVSKIGILVRDKYNIDSGIENSAIICEAGGGATKIHKNAYLVDEGNLLFCICDKIYSIDLQTLKVNWKVKADQATCFSIYKFGAGYIVHGELQLTQLNKSGEILWEFMARDIFVIFDNQKEFRIEDELVIVKDWSGFEYFLNSEGKVIKEIRQG